jgi:hypothetical protein
MRLSDSGNSKPRIICRGEPLYGRGRWAPREAKGGSRSEARRLSTTSTMQGLTAAAGAQPEAGSRSKGHVRACRMMRVRWFYWPSAEPGLAHRARQGPRSCVAHGAWVHQTERHRAAPAAVAAYAAQHCAPCASRSPRRAPPSLLPPTPRDECGGSTWARAQRGTIARDLRRPHHPRAQHEPTCTSRILVEGRAMEKQRRKAARARPTTRAASTGCDTSRRLAAMAGHARDGRHDWQ